MTSTTDLFTPAPGTSFVFSGVMTVKAVRYDGDSLICHGLNGWDDHHVYKFTATDRADFSQFRALDEKGHDCDEHAVHSLFESNRGGLQDAYNCGICGKLLQVG